MKITKRRDDPHPSLMTLLGLAANHVAVLDHNGAGTWIPLMWSRKDATLRVKSMSDWMELYKIYNWQDPDSHLRSYRLRWRGEDGSGYRYLYSTGLGDLYTFRKYIPSDLGYSLRRLPSYSGKVRE